MFRMRVDSELNLVLVQESLARPLFDLIERNRDHLGQWLPWVPMTRCVADTTAFIRKSLVAYAHGNGMGCAIEYLGEIVGVISYHEIDQGRRRVEIGYWLASDYGGKGIMTRCCKCLIDYAIEKLCMEHVEIKVAVGNTKSKAICQRLGLDFQRLEEKGENLGGAPVDLEVYGNRAGQTEPQGMRTP